MSEQINELMAALAKAQSKIRSATKDKANPFFKSKYADLASIYEACREQLSENGLATTQCMSPSPQGINIITVLGHSSGQWIKSEMPLIFAKSDPQTIGSTITYFRRYSLAAIVGVAPEDDDGEKAQAPYRAQRIEESKVLIKKVSQKEVEELQNILCECDVKYTAWVYDYMQKTYKTD